MLPTELKFAVASTVVLPEIERVVPALTALAKDTLDPEEVIPTDPADEVTVAFVAVDTAPEPDSCRYSACRCNRGTPSDR
jgi:hypothetical protein